jgi:hypothetical protein
MYSMAMELVVLCCVVGRLLGRGGLFAFHDQLPLVVVSITTRPPPSLPLFFLRGVFLGRWNGPLSFAVWVPEVRAPSAPCRECSATHGDPLAGLHDWPSGIGPTFK